MRRGGVDEALSMPPISHGLVSAFLAEVIGESSDELDRTGMVTSAYQSDDGGHYTVNIEASPGKLRLAFAQASAPKAAPPARPTPVSAPLASTATAAFVAPANSEANIAASNQFSANPDFDADTGARIAELCAYATDEGASDLFLTTAGDARLRIADQLRELPGTAMSEAELRAGFTLTPTHLAELDQRGSVDFAIEPRPGARLRVNLFRHAGGLSAALRPIRLNPPTLAELNLPASLNGLAAHPNGLVLVTGMAGSGKSTTLVAIVEQLNRGASKHIITLEDPIEYRYQSRRALIHQREIGAQVCDFATGLRAALREAPNVILLGEMRDRETIAAALTAAETGHLVLATLHASNAMVAIDRMIDIFPDGQQRQIRIQLSIVLREILTQYLLPTADGNGRVPAYERMITNDAISANIRDDKTHHIPSAIQTGRSEGMVALELSLARLVRAGNITRAEGLARAKEKSYFTELLHG